MTEFTDVASVDSLTLRRHANGRGYVHLATPSVGVVLVRQRDDRDPEMLLVTQYRPTMDRATLEIPGGKVEPGETPEEAALRELGEECGLRGQKAELLHSHPLYPANGYSDEQLHLLGVRTYRRDPLLRQTGNKIMMHWIGMDLVRALICTQITDAKTILAFHMITPEVNAGTFLSEQYPFG